MTIITRRAVLSGVAASSVGAGASMAQPTMSPREKAIWHMLELERLAFEDGAGSVAVFLVGLPRRGGSYETTKMLAIHHSGRLDDVDGMFAGIGG